jgi:outer membrane protein assembly factor BamB
MRTRTVLTAVLVCAATTTLPADNWPNWRGPLGIGVTTESQLPERWGPEDNVAWKATVRGLGISSPIVWGERVLVTSQAGHGGLREGRHPTLVQGPEAATSGERPLGGKAVAPAAGETQVTFLVTALSRKTGQRLWEYEMPAEGALPPVHEKHNLATPSPVSDGERVYAWFGSGQLVALDMNGKLVWQRNLAKEYSPFEIEWGHGSSPVVWRNSLLLLCYHNPSSYLLSLDARTGKVRWKVDRGAGVRSWSTPLVVDTPQGAELVINSTEAVEAFDPNTGDRLWQLAEPHRFAIPMPVHNGGVLYLSRGYRSGPYMALKAGGRRGSSTEVVWKIPTGAPYVPSLLYYDGLLYMASELGIVRCIDPADGQMVWQERMGGIFTASPVAGDGKIYLLSETGETVVLKAGRTPTIVARNHLDGRFIASPAISEGRLYFRSDDGVTAVGSRPRQSSRR